jgi:uncharacterized protein (TIGR03437 family)
MNRTPKLPRLLCFLIALVVTVCFVASFAYERGAAQPANGRIAFVNEFAIYTITADGSILSPLTPIGSAVFDRSPAWSPDGAKIAFARTTATTKSQIYVMNADGGNPTRITNTSASERQPSWSPDGTKIAFVSDRDGNDEIYVMNADGSNQTRLTNNTGLDFDEAWSPDGTKIVFTSSRDFTNANRSLEIYLMNGDGSNQIRLTTNSAIDAQPSWSADGTRIAFTSQRDGLPLVYVMNADGSNQTNITQSTTLDSSDPEWSPDGTTIAFTSYDRVGQTNSDEIFFMNADGANIRRITNTTLDEHELAWQPLASAPAPTPTPTATPTPSPTPDWTISGTVTDSTGKGLADVTMILQSSTADTQIIFTDQNGNYVFHYPGGNGLFVTPSKAGFVFNPLSIGFVSSSVVTGDQTASFTGTPSPISVGFPILLGQQIPQRAIALDSVTMTSEPFTITNTHNLSLDQRTRVSLFAVNVDLATGEPYSVLQAQAEDSLGQIFPLTIEYFGAVPNFPWLKQVIVKLPDELADKIEVRVSLKLHGLAGNKVIIRVSP